MLNQFLKLWSGSQRCPSLDLVSLFSFSIWIQGMQEFISGPSGIGGPRWCSNKISTAKTPLRVLRTLKSNKFHHDADLKENQNRHGTNSESYYATSYIQKPLEPLWLQPEDIGWYGRGSLRNPPNKYIETPILIMLAFEIRHFVRKLIAYQVVSGSNYINIYLK